MAQDTFVDFVDSKAKDARKASALGVVTQVYEHSKTSDRSNHEANVRLVNYEEEFRRIPVHVQHNGHVAVPQTGDFVEVGFLGGERMVPFVANFAYSAETRAPLGRAGHWRHRFGSNDQLFIEAEPADHSAGDPDVVRLAKKPDGLSDPTTTVEIDDSGSTTVVRIDTDGKVDVDADDNVEVTSTNGNVVINGGTKGAIHDVTTTTDADGHVTGITLERRSNILI